MIDAGLFSPRPELQHYDKQEATWAKEVIRLRHTFYESDLSAVLDDEKVAAAVAIGDFFGSRWQLPMAAALLAL
jgi:hypothetical protein